MEHEETIARCYHEAGHAVMAVYVGMPIEDPAIYIESPEGSYVDAGPVDYADTSNENCRRLFLLQAGGPYAQMKQYGPVIKKNMQADLDFLEDIIATFDNPNEGAKMQRIWEIEANEQIHKNWDVIEAIVQKLQEEDPLSRAEVLRLWEARAQE